MRCTDRCPIPLLWVFTVGTDALVCDLGRISSALQVSAEGCCGQCACYSCTVSKCACGCTQHFARISNLRAHKCTAHCIFLKLHCSEDCSFCGALIAPSMLTYQMCSMHPLQQLHSARSWHQAKVRCHCGGSAIPSLNGVAEFISDTLFSEIGSLLL